ncbi:sigma-54-dependent Fis family transcriptional regulator [Methylibium sp. Root1272]|uniref:sigma-54-dependent Fis family transcriptional regulator n=1 Tax=Methylibium sp. Root1272 TaxID=1736441 RepID=UPI0009E83AD4|nr:sigma-54-dependent Fis family transcriptional regulator [Methylibium sp. Root1272]
MKFGHQELTSVERRHDEATAVDSNLCVTQFDPARDRAIEASHQRCREMQLSRLRSNDFDRLSRMELTLLRDRNKRLLTHATPLAEMIIDFSRLDRSVVAVADAKGTILHCCGNQSFLDKIARLPLGPGINWSEPSRGTNAIGTCLVTEQLITVHGEEHFIHSYEFLTGSSTPLFDPRGDIVGAIAVLGDKDTFSVQAMSLLQLASKMIQNQWLTSEASQMLRLHFHHEPNWIGTPAEGIISLDQSGRVHGCNQAAQEMLATSAVSLRKLSIDDIFKKSTSSVLDHFSSSLAPPLRLQSKDARIFHVVARFFESEWRHHCGQRERSEATASKRSLVVEIRKSPQIVNDFLAADPVVQRLLENVEKLIDKGVSILIHGETGTGKEVLAKAIHQKSARSKQPFVAINCASIPESLIESELFGYEEGAFTGARRKGAAGKVLQAHGGTLFLDEIGDMPLALQARLLRVLQEREVIPLGGSTPVPVDVSVISATHRALPELISLGAFRQDLYYRLNGYVANLPPLRDRKDIPQLVNFILHKESDRKPPHVDPDLLQFLCEHPWPGNIRQLHNTLKTALALGEGRQTIGLDCLPSELLPPLPLPNVNDSPRVMKDLPSDGVEASTKLDAPELIHGVRHGVDDDTIRKALSRSNGNISAAARELGVCRNTIYRRLYWVEGNQHR